MEFLIGAVKLQLSVKMRHLSVVLTFRWLDNEKDGELSL